MELTGALDAHAAVVVIDDNFGVGVEPGRVDNIDGAEVGGLKVAGVEDVAFVSVALSGHSGVFGAAVAAGNFHLGSAVFEAESLSVNVEVKGDGTDIGDGAAVGIGAFSFPDGEPAGAFFHGRFEGQFAVAKVEDVHRGGGIAGGVNNAAARHFQLGAADFAFNGFAGNVVDEHAFAGPAEETQSRIGAVFPAGGGEVGHHDVVAQLHFQDLVVVGQRVDGEADMHPLALVILNIIGEVKVRAVGMEVHGAILVGEGKFAARAVVAAGVGGGEAFALDVVGDLQIVLGAQAGRVGERRVGSAVAADLVDLQAFFVAFSAAGDDGVLFFFPVAAVDGLPAGILGQNVALFHVVEVGLIDEAVLPDEDHGAAAVGAAVEDDFRFIAAAVVIGIALEVNVFLVDQGAARRVDGQPGGGAADGVVDLSVGAGVVDGGLQLGLADRDVHHFGSVDRGSGGTGDRLDKDAVVVGLVVGAHGVVLRGEAQQDLVGGIGAGDAAFVGHAVDAAGHDFAVHSVPEDPAVAVIADVDVGEFETAGAGGAFAAVAVEVQVEETGGRVALDAVEGEKVSAGTRSELEGDLGQFAAFVLRADLDLRGQDHVVGVGGLAFLFGQFQDFAVAAFHDGGRAGIISAEEAPAFHGADQFGADFIALEVFGPHHLRHSGRDHKETQKESQGEFHKFHKKNLGFWL